MNRYGIMTVNNAATPQAGVSSTPAKLTNLGATGTYYGVTLDNANNRLIVKVPGLYHIFAQVSFQKETTDGADNYHIFLYRNGVTTGYGFARYLAASVADLGSGSLNAILDLNVNDVLELYVFTDAAGPSTVTVVDAQFGLMNL